MTDKSKAMKKKWLASLPVLTKSTAQVGRIYQWPGGWVRLTRIIRLTEQEANKNALLYLDHWEGIDHNGMFQGAAFPDGDKLSTTKNCLLCPPPRTPSRAAPDKATRPHT